MGKFTRLPVIVEAVQWNGRNLKAIKKLLQKSSRKTNIDVNTGSLGMFFEGSETLVVLRDDWLVFDEHLDHFYTCTTTLFEALHPLNMTITVIGKKRERPVFEIGRAKRYVIKDKKSNKPTQVIYKTEEEKEE